MDHAAVGHSWLGAPDIMLCQREGCWAWHRGDIAAGGPRIGQDNGGIWLCMPSTHEQPDCDAAADRKLACHGSWHGGKRADLPLDVLGKGEDFNEWLHASPIKVQGLEDMHLSKPDLVLLPGVTNDQLKTMLDNGRHMSEKQ